MAITTEATRISARDIPLWSRSNAYTRWIMSWARDSSREGDGDCGGGAGRRVGEREGCRGKGSAQIAEDDISRGGQRESLRQGHHAAGVGPRPRPDGAAAPGEAHAHLGGRGKLHADIVVLLDGEPARLIEERHNLLGAGPCRRRLVVGDEERNGHHGQEADDGADDDELCHAVASAADARESPAGASRTDRHDRAISSMGASDHPRARGCTQFCLARPVPGSTPAAVCGGPSALLEGLCPVLALLWNSITWRCRPLDHP